MVIVKSISGIKIKRSSVNAASTLKFISPLVRQVELIQSHKVTSVKRPKLIMQSEKIFKSDEKVLPLIRKILARKNDIRLLVSGRLFILLHKTTLSNKFACCVSLMKNEQRQNSFRLFRRHLRMVPRGSSLVRKSCGRLSKHSTTRICKLFPHFR